MPQEPDGRLQLAAILALGLALRASGIGFGLPIESNLYIRPDESLIVTAAARFFETHGNPEFFAYPALLIEICAVVFGVVLWPWRAAAHLDLATHFGVNASLYFLTARWVSVLAGTATIAVVWRLGRRLGGSRAGISAALLFACAPLAARDAHFAVTDTLLTLLLTMAGLEAMNLLEGHQPKALWRMALWYGLALSTKYTALAVAPLLGLASLYAFRAEGLPRAIRRVSLAALASALLFAALNPYVFLSPRESAGTVHWVLHILYGVQPGDPAWTFSDAVKQVWRPLPHGPGGVAGVALAALFVFMMRKRGLAGVIAILTPVVFLLALIPFRHTVPYRYVLPVFPWIAALAAAVLASVGRAWIGAVIALFLAASGTWQAGQADALLARTDTRTLAGVWLGQNVPAGVPIVFDGGPECEPQVRETRASLLRRIEYAHRLYGQGGIGVVSTPYRLRLRIVGPRGFEVFRDSDPPAIPASEFFAVVPSYPLPMCAASGRWRQSGDDVQVVHRVVGLRDPRAEFELDRVDAFFLPFDRLTKVERPGPDFTILRVRHER
jgi:hypothetical protein